MHLPFNQHRVVITDLLELSLIFYLKFTVSYFVSPSVKSFLLEMSIRYIISSSFNLFFIIEFLLFSYDISHSWARHKTCYQIIHL